MPRITPVIAAAVAAIAALNPAPASAQANRTFVSGFGSDGNNCSFQNPCRTFAAALGEIAVLDPAEYGVVTITQAVSIVNDGVGVASITSTGAVAITINAGANDVVDLRGLTLTGADTGPIGIQFNTGGALNIQNCAIRGFTNAGIEFQPNQSGTLTVLDTILSNNVSSGGSIAAIDISPGPGSVNVYLSRVQVSGNGGAGIGVANSAQMSGSLTVTVVDSVATGNPNGGGMTVSGGAVSPTVTLINTRLTNNQVGLFVTGAIAYLAETVISGNSSHGFDNAGATINSFGNNRITDTNNSGSLTSIAKQ